MINEVIDLCHIDSYSLPRHPEHLLFRLNDFLKHYKNVVSTLLIAFFFSTIFIYHPFIWVISLGPIPYIAFCVIKTHNEWKLHSILEPYTENEAMIASGVVGMSVAFFIDALVPMLISLVVPIVVIIVLALFRTPKEEPPVIVKKSEVKNENNEMDNEKTD